MRISECAEITGTTVRTIRHYHHVGLLPVPEQRGGHREYNESHVARLLRIRWLAGAGLSLDAIAKILEPDGTALDDLIHTEELLTQQLHTLKQQRERVRELIRQVEQGRELTPITVTVEDFYTRVISKLSDPDAIALVRREMRLAELMAHRGLIPKPKKLDAIMATLDDEAVDRAVFFYEEFAKLPRDDEHQAQQRSDALLLHVTQWAQDNHLLTEDVLSLIPRWGRTAAGIKAITGLCTILAPHRRQAEFLQRLIRELLPRRSR